MECSFKIWLEMGNQVEDAILGILGGKDSLNDTEKAFILRQRTTEFSSDLLNQIRNLGIVKQVADDDMTKYSAILHSIAKGVTIAELVHELNALEFVAN